MAQLQIQKNIWVMDMTKKIALDILERYNLYLKGRGLYPMTMSTDELIQAIDTVTVSNNSVSQKTPMEQLADKIDQYKKLYGGIDITNLKSVIYCFLDVEKEYIKNISLNSNQITCKHERIEREDGCDTCLDCGERNW
jgi:hypothetical protein